MDGSNRPIATLGLERVEGLALDRSESADCGLCLCVQALPVAEPLIDRGEVIALLFNVSDIADTLTKIERLLEEDDGEEEADEG